MRRRAAGTNIWLAHDAAEADYLAKLPIHDIPCEVLPSEEAVGRAMFEEITDAEEAKAGSLVVIIVGGRGGQALHRLHA